jgi:predicted alpha-1,2-mannosidase
MGGKKNFVQKLQDVFDKDYYDPTNEPDIVYPYLFSRIKGEEWRTQREVKRLLEKHYQAAPGGLPGNDDTGTMSAWAVFSMMGFYPDCPGEPYYTLTTPVFDRVEIDTPQGTIVITASRKTTDADYIKTIKVGGKKTSNYRISHEDLLRKRNIHLNLSNRP